MMNATVLKAKLTLAEQYLNEIATGEYSNRPELIKICNELKTEEISEYSKVLLPSEMETFQKILFLANHKSIRS